MIGQRLSPVLVEIEETLWEFECHGGGKPGYTKDGFRAATKIFMSALTDKIWELQTDENIDMDARGKMAEAAGMELRKLILTYTGLDTVEMYKAPPPAKSE